MPRYAVGIPEKASLKMEVLKTFTRLDLRAHSALQVLVALDLRAHSALQVITAAYGPWVVARQSSG